MIGAVWFGLRLFWLNWRFRSRIARLDEVFDPTARQLLDECASLLGVRRRVRLIETKEVESPSVFGVIQARLLMPEGTVARFSRSELRHIFLHELAHLKRRDLELNWFVEILRALHWFNPALCFAFSRMRADREIAADAVALAVAGSGDKVGYGETILKILEGLSKRTVRPGAVGIGEGHWLMAERMRAIAGHGRTIRWSWAAAGIALALAALGLTDQSVSSRKSAPARLTTAHSQAAIQPASPSSVPSVKNTAKSSRTPAVEAALKTLRASNGSPIDPATRDAAMCIQSSIIPTTTELIPDLISIVIENPKVGGQVENAFNQYAIWSILNRQAYGMEYSGEFKSYLQAPALQGRLMGAYGMAVMDRESAGPETLNAAFEGLKNPDDEPRRWAKEIFSEMFPGQFRFEGMVAVSTNQDGILARMFPPQAGQRVGHSESFAAAEVMEAKRTLWTDLARICRDRLPSASRVTTPEFTWMFAEDNWAATQGRLGRAVFEQAKLTAGPAVARLLAEAVRAYRAAMEEYTRDRCAPDWAWYEDNLGLVLLAQSERARGSEAIRLATEAVNAHRAALDAYPKAYYTNRPAEVSANLRRAEDRLQELGR